MSRSTVVRGLHLGLAGGLASGLAFAVVVTPAAAAAPTPAPTSCRGEAATLILIPDDGTLAGPVPPGATVLRRSDSPSPIAQGTPGRDVVVMADSSLGVDTGAGDDLVCVVGSGSPASMWTRDGSDAVDTTQRFPSSTNMGGRYDVEADLGAGDDLFFGGPARDQVFTRAGTDQVSTGAGNDRVRVGAPTSAAAVDLGGGDDVFVLDGQDSGGVSGGTGSNTFEVVTPEGRPAIDIDASLGRADVAGLATFFHDFVAYAVTISQFDLTPSDVWRPWSRLTFRGSDADETLSLYPSSGFPQDTPVPTDYGPVDVDLGGGDDALTTNAAVHGRLVGGSGTNSLSVDSHWGGSRRSALQLDLAKGQLRYVGSGNPRSRVKGFTDLKAGANHVDLRGSRRSETIALSDINTAHVSGGGGNDRVDAGHSYPRDGVVLRGGSGNDLLVGSPGHDILIGGPGRDKAKGGPRRDTCEAEVRIRC